VHVNGLNFLDSAIEALSRVNSIARLSLFGSILRDDFCLDSDVDMLVEFRRASRQHCSRWLGRKRISQRCSGARLIFARPPISPAISGRTLSLARGCSMPRDPRDVLDEDRIRLTHMLE